MKIIIVRAGEVGFHIAEKLSEENQDVFLIDKDPDKIKNYFTIPFFGKWVLIFCMLLGRLEIYTVIVLLMPEYWRK